MKCNECGYDDQGTGCAHFGMMIVLWNIIS